MNYNKHFYWNSNKHQSSASNLPDKRTRIYIIFLSIDFVISQFIYTEEKVNVHIHYSRGSFWMGVLFYGNGWIAVKAFKVSTCFGWLESQCSSGDLPSFSLYVQSLVANKRETPFSSRFQWHFKTIQPKVLPFAWPSESPPITSTLLRRIISHEIFKLKIFIHPIECFVRTNFRNKW